MEEVASSTTLDLNLLPIVKREPKEEPYTGAEFFTPTSTRPASAAPSTADISSAAVLPPLQALPPNPEVDDLFAEYFRITDLVRSTGAPVPGPPPETSGPPVPASAADDGSPGAVTTVAASSVKKRKPRSSELVRVSSLALRDQIYFRDLVRRARITFEALRALLLKEEDRKLGVGLLTGGPGTGLGSGFDGIAAATGSRRRTDLRAAAMMADHDLWLNRDRRIVGPIPGISIGDAFFYRMELCVLGLHGQVQAGIDYVTACRSTSGEPIATSIIVSGGYEDDDDQGDILIYTGQGGRDQNLHKQCGDQRLEGGNLALERSMVYGIEIRVIRAVKSKLSPVGKIYFYDGLYRVVQFWQETGKAGFGVCKFKLLRIIGQEPMGSSIYRLAEQIKFDPLAVRPSGYLTFDISLGRENFPVPLFNDVDDDRDPMLFEYLARPIFPPAAVQGKFAELSTGGCDCTTSCSTTGCSCAQRNGSEFAYDKFGALLCGKPLVYECGPSCQCPASCPNRVSQNGLRYRLEVFRSRETGWGVRSLDLIRAGTFVCEFSGIVLTRQQSELLSANGECLVFPNRFPSRWLDWGDISDVYPEYVSPNYPPLPDLNFAIDVSRARNVACYLSHSCSPNVFVQFVLFDHYNPSYPHMMVFAMENIPPLRELSLDYGVIEEWVGQLTM